LRGNRGSKKVVAEDSSAAGDTDRRGSVSWVPEAYKLSAVAGLCCHFSQMIAAQHDYFSIIFMSDKYFTRCELVGFCRGTRGMLKLIGCDVRRPSDFEWPREFITVLVPSCAL